MTTLATDGRGARAAGDSGEAASVVIVGGGPRALSLLDRLGASASELLGDRAVEVHIVDPYPVGGGRIWRRSQSPLLWMNSMAGDITVFTDTSVICEGPIRPGPSLAQWSAGVGADRLRRAGLAEHAAALSGPAGFAPRILQAEYLSWAWERVEAQLPDQIRVRTHRAQALDVRREHRWEVALSDGERLGADIVVLAQGHLDRVPTADERAWAAGAATEGLVYLRPGYTADLDLSDLAPGADVLVSGFGLAFIDLMVLVGQGRGGTFHEEPDPQSAHGTGSRLRYQRSGQEPVLHVGSRRGVPYHAKLGYRVPGDGPVPPVHLTPQAIDALAVTAGGRLDFDRHVRPLIAKELTEAHYARLFAAHPERVRGTWDPLARLLAACSVTDPEFTAAIAAAVPSESDRFDIAAIDRPFATRLFTDRDDLSEHLVDYLEADLQRRADPAHSCDLAVFNALITVHLVLAQAIASGRVSAADRVRRVESEFAGFFSFVASGPPPQRLRELLALHRAGVVQFVGPDLRVSLEDGAFVARSAHVPGEVRARAFIEARLPKPDVLAAADPVIRSLLAHEEIVAEQVRDDDGHDLGGGLLRTDPFARALRPDESAHERLFLLGPAVSGSAGAAGFARPGYNGPGFRQNDAVARHLLRLVADDATHASHAARAAHAVHAAHATGSSPAHSPRATSIG